MNSNNVFQENMPGTEDAQKKKKTRCISSHKRSTGDKRPLRNEM